MRRLELDILFVVTRVALLFLLPLYISDLHLYLDDARKVVPGGQLPYLNWDFEYPPLAFPLFAIPAWIHDWCGMKGDESYRILFGLVMLPMDALLYLRFRFAPSFKGAAFTYILLTCAMSLLIYDRIDLAVGFLIALPFFGRKEVSDFVLAMILGIGGALKLVPLTLAPLRPMKWEGSLSERAFRFAKFTFFTSAPLLASCVMAAWLGKGKISFLAHHSQRGVQIESLAGSTVMWVQSFFHPFAMNVENNFGAQHLSELPVVIYSSKILFWGALTYSYLFLWWRRREFSLLASSWIVILAFVCFGYVLSPQFMLWLIPIGLLAAGELEEGARRTIWVTLFSLAVMFTGAHFRFYWDYVNLKHLSTSLLLARNLLLVMVWFLSWRWMVLQKPKSLLSSEYDSSGSPGTG